MSDKAKKLVQQYNRQVDTIKSQQLQVDKLKNKLAAINSGNKTPTSLKNMQTELKNVEKELEKAQLEYDSFKDKFASAEMDLTFAKGSGNEQGIVDAQNLMTKLDQDSMNSAIRLDDLQNKADSLRSKINNIKMNPNNSEEARLLASQLNVVESKLQTSKDKANNLKNSLNKALNQKSNLKEVLDSSSSKMGDFASKTVGMFSKKNLLGGMQKQLSSINKSISQFRKRITGLIASALIFNLLSAGFTKLREGIVSVLNSNNQFASSLNQIKANLLTAFAPIYNAALPAINALMSALSRITGTIATFVSSLFGQSVNKSKQQAKALYGQAQAIDAVKNSADNAKGSLADFDNLQVIGSENPKDNTGNGGVDFSGDIAQSSELLDYLNKIKELVSNGDFFGVGQLLANSVNDWLQSVDVVAFTDKVHKLLQNTVQVFNGFVNGLDWGLLGTKFSQLTVGLTGAVADAIKAVDWTALGKGINDFIKNVDLSQLTANLIGIFTNTIIGLTNMLVSIDWGMVSIKLSDAIITGLNTIASAISQIDWEGIGTSIREFLCNIDWVGILVAIAQIIVEGGQAFWDVLMGLFDGNEVISAIIMGIAIAIGALTVAANLANVAMGVFSGIMAVLTSPITLVVAAIGALIAIIVLCIKHWDDIKNAASICWEWIVNVWNIAATWFNDTIIQPIVNFFNDLWNGIKFAGSQAWESLKSIWNSVATWFNDTIINPVKNFFSGLWNSLKNGASQAWNGIKSVFSTVTSWFSSTFSQAWNAVKNVFSTGGRIFDGIKDGIVNSFKAIVNTIIRGINTVVSVPFNGINSALKTIKKVDILGVKPFSWLPTISTPQIPYLAKGAVIPPNAKFIAMLGDQRNGKNLEAPENLIRQIVREEAGEKEVVLNGTFVIQCGDMELAKATMRGVRLMEAKNGKKYFVN